jgi:hypothetical protein
VGDKAQLVEFNQLRAKVKPKVKLTVSPKRIDFGRTTTIRITVSGKAGTPTGTVSLKRVDGAHRGVLATRTLVHGKVVITYKPGFRGTGHVQATYSGDADYTSAASPSVRFTVR